MFNPIGSKATVCAFTYMPNIILTGHESGKVALFDVVSGTETLNNERAHMDTVTDLQLSPDRSYFVTSSKDKTARVSLPFIDHPSMPLIPSALQVARYQNSTSAQNIFYRNSTQ
jgi:WD40 repeat protein